MAHLAGLNAAQLSAVTAEAEVIQVLAPPGSGKTKTLTSRVAHLLGDRGFLPWNVICLTFTIKSAREMKERVAKLIGEEIGNKVILGTFHSVCRRYLAYYGHLIGMRKGFGIADTSDTTGIITRIVKRSKVNVEPKLARSRISSYKARNIGPAELLRETTGRKKGVDRHEFVTVFQLYQEYLDIANLLDYDDLLLRCLQLLQEHPECVNNVQAVLIDEFQDTNHVQFDLMNLFAQKCHHITAVGDPDQSIYGWRNAEMTNLTKMQERWPETLVVNLEQNYRSAGAILEIAQELIEQDTSRPEKSLAATHCRGKAPVFRKLPTAAVEAEWIVQEIKRLTVLSAGLLDYSDFAILLRSSVLSRQIEASFGKHGIPYRMVGGVKFFDRVEIKILLDYLRVVGQPDNSDALARIINIPSRKIGDTTVKSLLEEAIDEKTTMWKIILKAARGSNIKAKLNKPQLAGIESLVNIILTCQKKLGDDSEFVSPRLLLEHLVKKLGFVKYLEANYKEDHEIRWENVEQLFAQADDPLYCSSPEEDSGEVLPQVDNVQQESPSGAAEALLRFLANVALSTERQAEEETSPDGSPTKKVTISTIHAAKGLEWPIVFIPACYQGNIPHSRAENVDEERRLLYVAMTRAQALLSLSCPMRSSMGEETNLSSFIQEPKVQQMLGPQGHMLEYHVLEDIASILGRTCPAQALLAEAVRNAREVRILDDRWPLDGAPEETENERQWTNVHGDMGFRTAFMGSKRRKVSEEEAGAAAQQEVRSMLYSKTTMDSASGFTMPSQTIGFMSATQHMQIQHSIEAVATGGSDQNQDKAPQQRPSKSTTTDKPRASKREAGQVGLGGWLGGGKLKVEKSEAQPRVPDPPEVSTKTRDDRPPTFSEPPPQAARQPMSIARPAAANILMRQPSALKPLRKPMLNVVDRDSETRQPDISVSSPPPPETEAKPRIRDESLPSSIGRASMVEGSIRAASTSHNTTVSRLGQSQAAAPRALGMTGHRKAWTVRGGVGGVRPRGFTNRP